MKTIDEMIEDILRREGGYVNHPNDKGGATNLGISLRYALGIGLDLDKDGDTDKYDIMLVGPEEAAALYKQDFFYGPRIHLLPSGLHAQCFDIAVNSGGFRAIQLTQRSMRNMGYDLVVDGKMGKKTQNLAEQVMAKIGPARFNNELVMQRKSFYLGLVADNPSQKVFLKGWLARADEFKV